MSTPAPIYQVDAFTSTLFGGNPAAVVLLESYSSDEKLLSIAQENNLAETAFLVPEGPDYHLRWFTPTVEVPLCGHATLASAAVVLQRLRPRDQEVTFHTQSGPLRVQRRGAGFCMDFPARPMQACDIDEALVQALGCRPLDVLSNSFTYLAVLESEQQLRNLKPDTRALAGLGQGSCIVTAPSRDYDFVSRFFAPGHGIDEDPVTGSAHCALAVYWAEKLGKHEFHAFQASARGGELRCRLQGERVELEGECVFYLEGMIYI